MARDSGYPRVSGGNIATDFVWGNFPMQPDDDRTGTATQISTGDVAGDKGWGATTYVNSAALTKTAISKTINNGITLTVPNNHSVAENNWNGYPDYTPVAPYLDTTDQAAIPNVVGLTESAANSALVAASFVKGAVTTTTLGSTATIIKSYRAGGGGKSKIWTAAAHGFVVGDVVTVAGTNGNPDLEGSWTITDVTSDTFQYQTVTSGTITEAEDTGTAIIAAKVGKVKTQTPAAATVANLGTSVALLKYA